MATIQGVCPLRLLQLFNYLSRFEPQRVGEFHQLHHVDTALAAFQPCDEGLVFTQALGELCLSKSCSLAFCDQQRDKGFVPVRPKRLCHELTPPIEDGDFTYI
jgi:hypothetical protein